jgi:two-component system, OmpR family, response regulator
VGAHVLVVDDDPHILRMLTDVLTKKGFGVDTAKDGEEAYERALARAPDLIVTDVMMPRLDGWSLVRKLRLEPKLATLPVIFLTALTDNDDRMKAFRLGADDYVNKPFKLNDIVSRVEKVLGAKKEAVAAEPTAAPKAVPSSGLSGDLAQVGLSTLLVLIEMERKTGVLNLTAVDGRSGKMAVREGKVLDARIDNAAEPNGAQAVYLMLTWTEGKFAFTARDVAMEDKIAMSTTGLLMEGARLMDEAKAPEAEAQLNEDAIAEWTGDHAERTPVVAAAKLADMVRRSARASTPPYTQFSNPGIKLPPVEEHEKLPTKKPTAEPKPAAEPKPELVAEPKPEPVAKQPEPSTPAPLTPAATPQRRASPMWLVLGLVAAGAGAATFAIKPTATKQTVDAVDIRSDAAAIGAAIDRGLDTAQMRATGFASTPLLRTGIETDAATLQDMAASESLLQPGGPGEVIEIFQTRDGATTSLLRRPTEAPALVLDKRVLLAPSGKAIEVIATSPIKSQQGADAGTVAVSAAVDLQEAASTLTPRVKNAKLVGLERPIDLVPGAAGDSEQKAAVPSKGAPGLSLVVTTSAPPASKASVPGWLAPARYGAFALAALMLLLFVTLRRQRSS